MNTRSLWRSDILFHRSAIERNIIAIYILRSLTAGLGLAIPTIVSFWQDHGLSYSQIMWLEGFFALCCLVLEIPAGYLADRFARKQLLTVGGCFVLAGTVLYLRGETFSEFLLAELVFAFGFSSISGADEALLYDSLALRNEETRFTKCWSNALSLEIGIGAGAFIVGSIIASQYGTRAPFYGSALLQVLFVLVTLLLEEPERTRTHPHDGHWNAIVSCARSTVIENRNSRWIILLTAVMFAFGQSGFWLYQPTFKAMGVPIVYNGIIMASLGLGASFLALRISKWEHEFGFNRMLLLLIALVGTSYLAIGATLHVALLPLLFFHQAARAFQRVVLSEKLHEQVLSERRATSVSIKNMFAQLGYTVVMLGIGPIVDLYGLQVALFVLGTGLLTLGTALALQAMKS